MRIAADISGKVFGRLTVISRIENDKNGNNRWKWICECGNTGSSYGRDIRLGDSRSCGCLNREVSANRKIKHGLRKSEYYGPWKSMIERCTNKKARGYENYGGKGIAISDQWIESINQFALDMGPRPPGTTLDRIDNSKGYCKENCRWATRKEQSRNRYNNRLISYLGETKTLAEWSEYLGINKNTLYKRLSIWSIEKSFCHPVRPENGGANP